MMSAGFDGPIASVVWSTSTTDRPPEAGRRAGTYDRQVILRCTKKLLEVIRPEQLATPDPEDEDWYASLLVLDRRKCLLLTHAGTLFTIFEPDVRASDLRATKNLVSALIERQLLAESLPAGIFGDLRAEELLIAKTADRSVLGCMNDMAFLCEVAVADARSLALIDVASLNHRLHRNINSVRNYKRPIDLVIGRTAQ
jgi:hypothetical protein